MDILTHTLSGIAVGIVVSGFSTRGFKDKLKITMISGLGGALPDIDAISLWQGFDSTIGTFFHLAKPGKEIYSAKLWYSHHAFFHSIIAAIMFSVIIGLLLYGAECVSEKCNNWVESIKKNRLLLIGFTGGFLIHLTEDLPTPASTWGGIRLFWPLKTYIGGTGDIWWWNNYDIFLIVAGVLSINLLLSFVKLFVRFNFRKVSIAVFLAGFILVFVQVKTRDFSFAYSGHATKYYEFESKSKQIQKEILGDKLYGIMESFDNKMGIYF